MECYECGGAMRADDDDVVGTEPPPDPADDDDVVGMEPPPDPADDDDVVGTEPPVA
jgi:hypothetical protein